MPLLKSLALSAVLLGCGLTTPTADESRAAICAIAAGLPPSVEADRARTACALGAAIEECRTLVDAALAAHE